MAVSQNQGEKRSREVGDEGDQGLHLNKDVEMSMLTISKLKVCECLVDEDFPVSLVPPSVSRCDSAGICTVTDDIDEGDDDDIPTVPSRRSSTASSILG